MSDTATEIYKKISEIVTDTQKGMAGLIDDACKAVPGYGVCGEWHNLPVPVKPAEQPASDGLSLEDVEKMLSAHPAGLSKGIAEFLIRVVKAMNSRVAELETQLKGKESDYTGVCLEYADLSDENNRLKQELEISKIVADARGKTLLELQKELESVKAASVS